MTRYDTRVPTLYALAIHDALTREIARDDGRRAPERRLGAFARAVAVLSGDELARLVGELADPLVRDPRGRWHP